MKNKHKANICIISITWGKSDSYSPISNEPFVWDGSVTIKDGEIIRADQLHFQRVLFGPALEQTEQLAEQKWKSKLVPGSPDGLEGLRLRVNGDESTEIILKFISNTFRFTLGELISREYLRYRVGGKYSGSPVDVFLGPDARPRVSQKTFCTQLTASGSSGRLILPGDLSGAVTGYHFATYGAIIAPGTAAVSVFPIKEYNPDRTEDCLIKLQLIAVLKSENPIEAGDRWITIRVKIGNTVRTIRHLFTSFRKVQKLEDLYMTIPWSQLKAEGNELTIKNTDTESAVLVHRIYIGTAYPSHHNVLKSLPPLPEEPLIWVGYDTNTLTPENGEMDEHIRRLKKEELGNYLLFRLERRHASKEDLIRWAKKLNEYGIRVANCGEPDDTCDRIMKKHASLQYMGVHCHETSNLIYGWGTPEPIEERSKRTLPECQTAFLKRMANHKIVGEALPIQHLDYAAGVELVISEPPAGHASLLLAGARGAARAYDRKFWGVHIANHIPRSPADEDMERRNFILLYQSWLYGARLIYDEESALYMIHDAPYAYSDPLPYARRAQYQMFYHYASACTLGEPLIKTGFLQGNYDCLVGGLQSRRCIKPTKFWGAIGPETKSWEFDTPERGWELLSNFMPRVWLCPVPQDPRAVRHFFSGTPYGQIDLVPITIGLAKLSRYKLLILPGWNTMTEKVHHNLVDYVRDGGHLVICAAQCTEHITRDFLDRKRDLHFFRKGDLRELAGVRLGCMRNKSNLIRFNDGTKCDSKNLPGLDVQMEGAEILACDETGRPVLIEHRIGQGRVWMLTVGEYWGHSALDNFSKELCGRLAVIHKQTPSISGDTDDVDFHLFRHDKFIRVVLLNTDWTSSGNIKKVVLHISGQDIPLKIREGKTTQILIKDEFAVVFEMPPLLVDNLRRERGGITFSASGFGRNIIQVYAAKKLLKRVFINGEQQRHPSQSIELDFGPSWREFTKIYYE
jgi:hypothetical protein